jgi:hypothetical protein
MQPRQLVEELRDSASRYGARAALHDLECRVVNRVAWVKVLRAMRLSLADVPSDARVDATGCESRFVGCDALEPLARAGTHDLTPAFLARARARGDRCHAVFEGATLASYTWYARAPLRVDEFLLRFDPAYTYMFKGFTHPAYRGRRLYALGIHRALRVFTDEGQRGLVSDVASNNFASLRAAERMGYRIFGNVYLVKAGRHAFAHATRACRRYGFGVTVERPSV